MKLFRIGIALAALTAGMIGPAASAEPAAAAKAPAGKKEQPVGTIDGITIARPDGRFLGLQVLNSNLVLTFYDAKKHKVPADVARATARWSVKYQPQDERAVLNPGGDPTSLTSAKTVRPPHNFKVFLGLFVEGSDAAVESYNVDLLP